MGLFNDLFGGRETRKVTQTGFLKKDVEKFKTFGNTLAATNAARVPDAPGMQRKTFMGIRGPTGFVANNSAAKDTLTSFANIFKKRLNQIQQKRRHPGVMQTRGEL